MKQRKKYFLLGFFLLLLSCAPSSLSENYYFYYYCDPSESRKIDQNQLPKEKQEFTPNGIFVSKNRIYVANSSAGRVDVFDFYDLDYITSIESWEVNGKQEKLRSPVDVTVSNGKIYVACKASHRVDVFDEKTLGFISCLGTGSYQGDLDYAISDPYAVRVAQGKIFVKGRKEMVDVFLESDVSRENYRKTKKYTFLDAGHYNDRNSLLSLEIGAEGKLYLTDRYSSAIKMYDISNLPSTTQDLPISPVQTFSFSNKNFYGVASDQEELAVSFSRSKKKVVEIYNESEFLSGKASPRIVLEVENNREQKIFLLGWNLFVSNDNSISLFRIQKSLIREY